MEAAVANLVEPGEKVLVGNKGIWGARVADLAARYGADVAEIRAEAGRGFSLEELTKALEQHKPAVLFLCQARGGRRRRAAAGLCCCCLGKGWAAAG